MNKAVKNYMEKEKLTIYALAKKCGLSTSAIKGLLDGETNCRYDTLRTFCYHTKISSDELLGLKED